MESQWRFSGISIWEHCYYVLHRFSGVPVRVICPDGRTDGGGDVGDGCWTAAAACAATTTTTRPRPSTAPWRQAARFQELDTKPKLRSSSPTAPPLTALCRSSAAARAEYSRVQPNEQSAGFGQSVRVDSIEEYDSSILAKSQSVEQRLLRYVRAGCRSDRPARQCKGSLLPVRARAATTTAALRRGPVVPSVWSVSDQSVSHRVSYGSRTVFCSFATSLLF